jgi:hypothetical protein
MADYQKVEIVKEDNPAAAAAEQQKIESLTEELKQQEAAQQQQIGQEEAREASLFDQQAEERPEWLPDKFVSPEQLAKAYNELESKLSAPETGETESGDLEPLSVEDFSAFSEELQLNGDVSEESKQQLVDWGLPREIVEAHVEGLKARVELEVMRVQSEVGGPEAYENMIKWATENLSQEDQDAFDAAVVHGQEDQVMFAVRSLKARWEAAGGRSGQLIQGATGTSGSYSGFNSLAELTTAMKDPRYKNDVAYRREVETRLGNSNIL